MKKKGIAGLLVMSMIVAVIGGCGDKGNAPTTAQKNNESQTSGGGITVQRKLASIRLLMEQRHLIM